MNHSILRIGYNCSCIKRISSMAILVDGNEYFEAFFNVAQQAKKSIDILGWEVDSRIGLDHISKSLPNNLRNYFNNLTTKNGQLQVNIMSWKPTFFLFFDREWFASAKWKLKTTKNITFKENPHLDVYGTYHEKIAIIDERCAFVGGMDITRKRWDTCEHDVNNPLRKDQDGTPYHPIHDVQMVCTGEFAQELSHYLQKRNKKTNNKITIPLSDPWPVQFAPQLEDIKAAISRTDSAEDTYEIEMLYLDAIKNARRFIYIENQYYSHDAVTSLLCQKLMLPDGPEVVIVLPYSYRGLFEKAIYTNGRNKAIKRLKEADKYSRLIIAYPGTKEDHPTRFIVVHSKLMVIDNTFITLGSANLNYRSMRVDGELNVSIESLGEERIEQFIGSNTYRLLSEHLGVTSQVFKEEFEKRDSLLATINFLSHGHKRTLKNIPVMDKESYDHFLLLLTPFVDIQFPFPKVHLFLFFFVIIISSLIFMQEPL